MADGSLPTCEFCGGSRVVEGYGAFPGGDPRNFTPDRITPAYEAACADVQKNLAPAHESRDVGGAHIHVAHAGFGLGVYRMPCPGCCE